MNKFHLGDVCDSLMVMPLFTTATAVTDILSNEYSKREYISMLLNQSCSVEVIATSYQYQ